MTKETSPEALLKHKPISSNPALKILVTAARDAETPAPEPGA